MNHFVVMFDFGCGSAALDASAVSDFEFRVSSYLIPFALRMVEGLRTSSPSHPFDCLETRYDTGGK